MVGGGKKWCVNSSAREEKKVDGEEPRSLSMAIVVVCTE